MIIYMRQLDCLFNSCKAADERKSGYFSSPAFAPAFIYTYAHTLRELARAHNTDCAESRKKQQDSPNDPVLPQPPADPPPPKTSPSSVENIFQKPLLAPAAFSTISYMSSVSMPKTSQKAIASLIAARWTPTSKSRIPLADISAAQPSSLTSGLPARSATSPGLPPRYSLTTTQSSSPPHPFAIVLKNKLLRNPDQRHRKPHLPDRPQTNTHVLGRDNR